jgi:hypothetical protein
MPFIVKDQATSDAEVEKKLKTEYVSEFKSFFKDIKFMTICLSIVNTLIT